METTAKSGASEEISSAGKLVSGVRERIVSIDALRGFDMFWIIGAEGLVHGLKQLNPSPVVSALSEQLEHVAWEGFHFYDLIFPLFVFLMGASSVFSLPGIVKREGKRAAYWRIVKRSVLLYAIGVFLYGGLSRDGGPEMFRYLGVLQRIAICYLVSGLALINLRLRGLIVTCAALLLGYWALMAWVPVPGVGAGNFAEGENLTNYLDQHFLPGYKWHGPWDPEGLLSSLPAIGTAILGIFAGLLLRNEKLSRWRRVGALTLLGVGCLAGGYLWGMELPVIKKIWTSSYVLLAAGWSYLLLALFYMVIDIWKFQIWARPFVWIGMNSIMIYILTHLVDFRELVRHVVHQPLVDSMAPYGDLVVSILALLLAVGVCFTLYRKKIFLRV